MGTESESLHGKRETKVVEDTFENRVRRDSLALSTSLIFIRDQVTLKMRTPDAHTYGRHER